MILNFGKANANVFIKEHATKLQLFLFTTKKSGTTPWPQLATLMWQVVAKAVIPEVLFSWRKDGQLLLLLNAIKKIIEFAN